MKSYVKQALLVFVLGFTSLAAANNIRVIGKGGGMDEMEALTFFDQIPALIQFCLMENNPCALETEEVQKLKQFAETDGPSPQRISFNVELLAPVLNFEGTLQISSLNLSYSSLFSAYVNATLGPSSFPLEVAERIFNEQKLSLETLGLKRSSGDNLTPVIQSFKGSFGARIFVRQNEGKFISLDADLNDTLCGSKDGKDFRLLEVGGLAREEFGFSTKAFWVCEGTAYRGQLIARRNLQSPAVQFQFKLFSKEVLECGGWLK